MAEPAHAVLSASRSEQWLECPGSIWLSKGIKEVSGKYADVGTAAHSVSEFIQRDCMDDEAAIEMLKPKYLKLLEDEDMDEFIDAVYTYVDWMREQIIKYPAAKPAYEQKVRLDFIQPLMFGTSDFILPELFGRLVCGDYKHGKGVVVEIEKPKYDNPQAAYYTLATAHRYGYNFEEVEMVIIQPRAPHVEGKIRSKVIPMEEFREEWTERFTRGVERVDEAKNNPANHLTPGDHCRFCPARGTCPELRKKSFELAQMDFDPITLENSVVATQSKQLPDPATLTEQQLVTVLDHASMIDSWIKGVNVHAEHLLDSDDKLKTLRKFYKMVPSRPTRKWIDPKKVKTALKRRKSLVEEDYHLEPKMLSPNQFEGRHKRSNPKLWAAMQKHIHRTSGSRTLTNMDDKRPALEHKKAKDDFDAIPE